MYTKTLNRATALITALIVFLTCLIGFSSAMGDDSMPDVTTYYKKKDVTDTWDEADSIHITLGGNTFIADRTDNITLSGTVLTLSASGTYVLTGTWNGQIRVTVPEDEKIQLVLSGVSIVSEEGPAIMETSADKIIVTVQEGTVNTLTDATSMTWDDDTLAAALYAQDDLSLNGAGTLTVNGNAGHGIQSKADIVLSGLTLQVTSAKDAIRGKNSVLVLSGTYELAAQGDGICATNTEKEGKGYVMVAGGTIKIKTGDGAGEAKTSSYAEMQRGGFGQYSQTASTDDSVSQKGIKAATVLYVLDGVLTLDCADDGLHAVNISIYNGTMNIRTGDDGIHADETTLICGGTITIEQCYEGIEGTNVTISGGDIAIIASDDGVNASGGNDMSGFGGRDAQQGGAWGMHGRNMQGGRGNQNAPQGSSLTPPSGDMPDPSNGNSFSMTPPDGSMPETGSGIEPFAAQDSTSAGDGYLLITGGTVTVTAGGDALDANGSLALSGGTITVYARTTGGEGAIDFNGSGTVSGATLIIASLGGVMSDTAQLSGQSIMSIPLSQTLQAGSTLILQNADSETLAALTLSGSCDTVLITSGSLNDGDTLSLLYGNSVLYSGTMQASSLQSSDMMGGFGRGNFGGGRR